MSQSLQLVKGDYISKPIQFDVYANGAFVSHYNLTGKTVFFTMKGQGDNGADDSEALISKTITVHSDPTNGITTLVINPGDWANVPLGTYKWNFKIMYGSNPSSCLKALVDVVENVTIRTS